MLNQVICCLALLLLTTSVSRRCFVAACCRNEFAFNQVIAEQGEKLGELSAFALPPDS